MPNRYEYAWVDKYDTQDLTRLGAAGWRVVPGIASNLGTLLLERVTATPKDDDIPVEVVADPGYRDALRGQA